MEYRVKKPVDYKVLNTKGKVDDDFDISTEMTPIKSKSVSKIETIALIHDDSDDDDGAEDNGSDGSLSDDEELVALKKEMESLNKEKKKIKLQTKKDKIKKEIEKSRKELKRKTEKSKGDKLSISDIVVKANKSVNNHDLVNINDLRKNKSLKAKAQSKVKQLLEINDSSSDDESVKSSSDSEVSDDNTKKSKRQKAKSKTKSGILESAKTTMPEQ